MTFKSRNTSYTVASTILHTAVNDCYTAKPEGGNDGREFLLVVINDHDTVRSFMETESKRVAAPEEGMLIETFTSGQSYVLVFPYRQERPLDRFFVGEAYTLERCENICTNLLLSCISCMLPYPYLYLILEQ